MTNERLKELNEIKMEIENIKESMKILDYAERLQDNLVLSGPKGVRFLNKEHVDFELLKQSALASLNERLAKLEEEFKEA